jgi:hypothetical protein
VGSERLRNRQVFGGTASPPIKPYSQDLATYTNPFIIFDVTSVLGKLHGLILGKMQGLVLITCLFFAPLALAGCFFTGCTVGNCNSICCPGGYGTLGGYNCPCCGGGSSTSGPYPTPYPAPTSSSCPYANDGECDVPMYCNAGTDGSDCTSSTSGANSCLPTECPYISYINDNYCDSACNNQACEWFVGREVLWRVDDGDCYIATTPYPTTYPTPYPTTRSSHRRTHRCSHRHAHAF